MTLTYLDRVRIFKLKLSKVPARFRSREVVLAAVQNDGGHLMDATYETIRDREIVLAAMDTNGLMLQIATEFQNDREVVLRAVANQAFAFQFASDPLRYEMDVVCAAIEQDGNVLSRVPLLFRECKEVVMKAVAKSIFAWSMCGDELKGDRDVALCALSHLKSHVADNVDVESIVAEMPAELWEDAEVVTALLRKMPAAYQYMSPAIREVRANARVALKRSPGLYHHLSPALRMDAELTDLAIQGRHYNFSLATHMHDHKPTALNVVSRCASTYQYLSERLKADVDVLARIKISRYHPPILLDIPDSALMHRDTVVTLVDSNPGVLPPSVGNFWCDDRAMLIFLYETGVTNIDIPGPFREDKQVVMAALLHRGELLWQVSNGLLYDKEVLTRAIESAGSRGWRLVPPSYRNDADLLQTLVRRSPGCINRLKGHPALFRSVALESIASGDLTVLGQTREFDDDLEVIQLAMDHNPRALLQASSRLKAMPDLARRLVQFDGMAILSLPNELRDSEALVLEVVRHGLESSRYVDERFRETLVLARPLVHAQPAFFSLCSFAIRDNDELATYVAEKYPYALRYMSGRLAKRRDIVLLAVRAFPTAFSFLSDPLLCRDVELQLLAGKRCALDAAESEVRSLLAVPSAENAKRLEHLSDAAAIFCNRVKEKRVLRQRLIARAEALVQEVHSPDGFVVQCVLKRSFADAFCAERPT